jgi:hypothetical protein
MKIPGTPVPGRIGANIRPLAEAPLATAPLAEAPLAIAPAKAASGPAASRSLSPVTQNRVFSLLSSLGLPRDSLSASIVSFARFFSLPLEPELLAEVRRQTIASGAAANPGGGKNREALSLAALAATDKGLRLSAAALEEYSAAINGEAPLPEPWDSKAQRDNKPEADNRSGNNKAGGENTGEQGGAGQNTGGKNADSGEDAENETAPVVCGVIADGVIAYGVLADGVLADGVLADGVLADGALADGALAGSALAGGLLNLKEKILASGEANPLLDLLNRLAGKNGQRWIVLPFHFVEAEALYRISLKILLNPDQSAGHLILDILKTGVESRPCPAGQDECRRLFVMDRAKGEKTRLGVYLWPPIPQKDRQSLASGLAACLGLARECIFVQNTRESFPFVEHNPEDILPSINEEV